VEEELTAEDMPLNLEIELVCRVEFPPTVKKLFVVAVAFPETVSPELVVVVAEAFPVVL
jgi:hypothetical protein